MIKSHEWMQHHMYVQLNLWYRIGLILGGETTTMDVHGLYPRAITAQDLSPVRGGHDMSAIDHRLAILSCLFHVACRRVVFAGKKTVVVV